jgi:hypothetical protein
VAWFPPNRGQIIFYPPPNVCCAHVRYTKDCIAIREKLERLKRLQHKLATGVTIDKATLDEAPPDMDEAELREAAITLMGGQLKRLARELRKQGLDPDHAKPEDFCQYREPTDFDFEEDEKWWNYLTDEQPRLPHRPRKRAFDYVILGMLTSPSVGWDVTTSCRFLCDVLLYCFDISESPENVRQRWYTYRK